MATATQKTPKTPKPAIPVAQKVTETLTKAVLTKKISADELTALETHLGKLKAIVS